MGRNALTTTPSTVPNLDFGSPPGNVPLFYYADARQPSWLLASDWTGKPRGTVKRSPDDGVFPLYASADGSSVVVGSTVYGPAGRKVPAWQSGQGFPVWADDSHHMCGFRGQPNAPSPPSDTTNIQVWLPGEQPVQVGPVTGRAGSLEVAACSFQTNRVLVVERGPELGIRRWTVVALPDGRILHDQPPSVTGSQYLELVPSANGRYVSLMVMEPGPAGASTISSTIQDAATGAVLADLGRGVRVAKFSSDGAAILTLGPAPNDYSVTQWRTGKVVWTLSRKALADPHEVLQTMLTRPRGLGFVLAFWRPQGDSCAGGAPRCTSAEASPQEELLLVDSNGRQRIIARHVTLVSAGY